MISERLIANKHMIEMATLTDHECEIELQPCIRRRDALIFFADLIALVNPAQSEITLIPPFRIKMTFHASYSPTT